MKNSLIAISLAVGVANFAGLGAQSTTETTASVSTPAPESVTLSPSVMSGVRTFNSGNLAGGAGATTVGPFVRPAAALTFKNSKLSATVNYELEITGGKGLGSNKNSITENAYFQHNPVFVISGGILPNWKLNGVLDMKWKYANQDRDESSAEIFANPDIQYNITPAVSVSLGYVMHRANSFEADSIQEPTIAKAAIAKGQKARAAVSASLAGEKPTSTLHAGIVTTKIDLGDKNVLTAFVRAGKDTSNEAGKTAYAYRFQTHLDFATGAAGLTGALRYRLNIRDIKGSKDYDYYNLGLVQLAYAINTNWSINLSNEFKAAQSTAKGAKAAFENENYVGATFAF